MLAFLEEALKNSETPRGSLNVENFDLIVSLVEKEQLNEALPLIKLSFTESIFDIRLIVYYLYADFRMKGISAFRESLPFLTSLIQQHAEFLQPLSKREKQIEASLNWYFSHVLNKIKFFEKNPKEDAFWISSIHSVTAPQIEELLTIAKQFQDFFSQRWPNSSTKDRLQHLIKKFEEVEQSVKVEEEKISDPPPMMEEIAPVTKEEEPQTVELEKSLFNSPMMRSLIKKLEAFVMLIEKKEYLKAALVSKNITYELEHFDPCLYFPLLFTPYLSELVKNISTLSKQWEQAESLQWLYLEKICRADIEQLIQIDLLEDLR